MENSIALIIVIIIASVAGCCEESEYTHDDAERFRRNASYFEYKYNECDHDLSKLMRHVEEDCKCGK